MGEYIKYNGKEIKLGTCEDLYYARLDQLKTERWLLEEMEGNLSAREYLDPKLGWRYRFPFPDEDNIPLGEFEDYNRGLVVQLAADDYTVADFNNDHHHIWASCHAKGGSYNVNVAHPCPQSPEFKDVAEHSPITWRIVEIRQQKQVEGEVWTVIACPYCGVMVRIDQESAAKLTHSIEVSEILPKNATDSNRTYYQEVCRRILAGYKVAINT